MINKYLYWLIQITWGILTCIAGLIVTLVLRYTGCKSYKNGYGIITTVGGNWGGLSLGPFAFTGKYNEKESDCYSPLWYEHTRRHEFGHSIQVLFMGPFFIFIVAIPSAIRYWYQRIRSKKGLSNKPYDNAIFEYHASKWGYKAINKIEGTNIPYTFKRIK